MNRLFPLILLLLTTLRLPAQTEGMGLIHAGESLIVLHNDDTLIVFPATGTLCETYDMPYDREGNFRVKMHYGTVKEKGKQKRNRVRWEWAGPDIPVKGSGWIRIRLRDRAHKLPVDSLPELVITLEHTASRIQVFVEGKPFEGECMRSIRFRLPESSRLFGLGEQFSYLDLRGHYFPMTVQENGIGRGDRPGTGYARLAGVSGSQEHTYIPIPWFVTHTGHSYFGDWRWLAVDLREAGMAEVTLLPEGIDRPQLLMQADYNEQPLRLLSQHNIPYHRAPLYPDWVFGTWLGMQGGPEKADSLVNMALNAGVPVSGLWIQDWVGKRETKFGSRLMWHWQADSTTYPDLPGFIDRMNARGVHVLGYINPFLAVESPFVPEAEKRGCLCEKVKAGGFEAYVIDLQRCGGWMQQIMLREMADIGFSGWMADFGEWMPVRDDYRKHQEYPALWGNAQPRMAERGRDTLVVFRRSGFAGAGDRHLFWTGDQLTDWGEHDGIKSAVTALISSGMSGVLVNHSDIGGYTNLDLPGARIFRDRELFYRWCELAAFTPVFRTHEGLMPEKNVQPWTDAESMAFFSRMANVHEALRPYLKSLNTEAQALCLPMIRHPWLHYPEDAEVRDLRYQFMLGGDLMVIPVLDPGQTELQGYLPEGHWKHLFTGEILAGGRRHSLAAPLGRPAVFIRTDSDWAELLPLRIKEALERIPH